MVWIKNSVDDGEDWNGEVMPESLPAVLSTLVNSNCNEFTRSLVIDLGGTTLDMGIVVGEFDEVSGVFRECEEDTHC